MKIYELEEDWSFEERKDLVRKLRRAFPELRVEDAANMFDGRTHVCRSSFGRGSNTAFCLFYHFNVAVLNQNLGDERDGIATRLQELGYFVPAQQCLADDSFSDPFGSHNSVSPEAILWEELKRGRGWPQIKKRLEELLTPVLSTLPRTARGIEFATYTPPPFIDDSDDLWLFMHGPHQICPDETFVLPRAGNGMVDLSHLLEVLRRIPAKSNLAISSRVQTPRGEEHVPMIDFSEAQCGLDERAIRIVSQRLGLPGKVLVNSGNSFHHYDTRALLKPASFRSYLQCIGTLPEIGPGWGWLEATQGFSLLRIAPSAEKPSFPMIWAPEE